MVGSFTLRERERHAKIKKLVESQKMQMQRLMHEQKSDFINQKAIVQLFQSNLTKLEKELSSEELTTNFAHQLAPIDSH